MQYNKQIRKKPVISCIWTYSLYCIRNLKIQITFRLFKMQIDKKEKLKKWGKHMNGSCRKWKALFCNSLAYVGIKKKKRASICSSCLVLCCRKSINFRIHKNVECETGSSPRKYIRRHDVRWRLRRGKEEKARLAQKLYSINFQHERVQFRVRSRKHKWEIFCPLENFIESILFLVCD